jgi:Tol biopolymer transport system component
MKGLVVAAAAAALTAFLAPGVARAGNDALVVSTWRGSGAARNLDLALVRADGTGTPRFLTHVAADDVSPSWSPDGRTIVFARRGAVRGGIYVLAGSTTRRLTHGADDGAPAFSPDGRTVAFARRAEIMLVDADGRHPRVLAATHLPPRQLSWTHDGSRILYSDDGSLRSVDVTTGVVSTIAANALRPIVSPDGTRVAFLASGGVGPWWRDLNWGVYVSSLDGSGRTRVAGGQFGPVSWSPDGSELLATDGLSLARVDVAAGTLTRLPLRGTGGSFRPPPSARA